MEKFFKFPKWLLLVLLLPLSVSLAFNSCSDDEDKNDGYGGGSEPLAGVWEKSDDSHSKITLTANGGVSAVLNGESYHGQYNYEANAGSIAIYLEYEDYAGSNETWALVGDVVGNSKMELYDNYEDRFIGVFFRR